MIPEPPEQRTGSRLPEWGTPFVGRSTELARLHQLLERPGCRLVTLFGPGGIGKTRLAAQFLRTAPRSRDALYVPLEADAELDAAIVKHLGIGAEKLDGRFERVVSALGEQPRLLVLDNFEHLAGQVATIDQLLTHCPNITIVVTSRIMLGLPQEWVLPVGGLPHLSESWQEQADGTDALVLFGERVEQARGSALDRAEMEQAQRICVQLEGIPLALELAASWANLLTLGEISRDIGLNHDLVLSRSGALPARQQSLRRVFEHSWELLPEAEQDAFARLSVFSDGFDREAAHSVASVDLHTLASLTRKSLVQREGEGRYRLHPLMLEYAAEELVRDQAASTSLRERHSGYFLAVLEGHRPDIAGFRQVEAVQSILRDWANIRRAWTQALAGNQLEEAASSLYLLDMVCSFRARYDEATEFADAALLSVGDVASPGARKLRYTALVVRAWVQVRLGNLDEATRLAVEAEKLLEAYGDHLPRGMHLDPRTARATVALVRGAFQEAEALATAARDAARVANDPGQLSLALYTLENAYWEQGRLDSARAALDEAMATCQSQGDEWFSAFLHNDIARYAQLNGDTTTARYHLQKSIELRSSLNDVGGEAIAQEKLARLELDVDEVAPAEQRFLRAASLYRQVGDQGGVASVHAGLGRVARRYADGGAAARERFLQALQEASSMGYERPVTEVLFEVAEMALAENDPGALVVLAHLAVHPGTPPAMEGAIRDLTSGQSQARWSEARRQAIVLGRPGAVEIVLAALRREPSAKGMADVAADALSPREMAVLRLLAEGASNATIGTRLNLKVGTVKWYTSQVLGKLGARNRTEAVARARSRDLIP